MQACPRDSRRRTSRNHPFSARLCRTKPCFPRKALGLRLHRPERRHFSSEESRVATPTHRLLLIEYGCRRELQRGVHALLRTAERLVDSHGRVR